MLFVNLETLACAMLDSLKMPTGTHIRRITVCITLHCTFVSVLMELAHLKQTRLPHMCTRSWPLLIWALFFFSPVWVIIETQTCLLEGTLQYTGAGDDSISDVHRKIENILQSSLSLGNPFVPQTSDTHVPPLKWRCVFSDVYALCWHNLKPAHSHRGDVFK